MDADENKDQRPYLYVAQLTGGRGSKGSRGTCIKISLIH